MRLGILLVTLIAFTSSARVNANPKDTDTEAEADLVKEMNALWEKIGPHAEKGSKLAKDNWAMFETYYRNTAQALAAGKVDARVSHQEIMSLMCIPTAYGWPMHRKLDKDIKYSGLVGVREAGDFEIIFDTSLNETKAKFILEVDGKPIKEVVTSNEGVSIHLEAGVRAITIKTKDDIQGYFTRIHVNRIAKK